MHSTLHYARERLMELGAKGFVPRDFSFVFLEVPLTSLRPTQSEFHGFTGAANLCRILGAFVKSHNDVCAQANLRGYGALRAEKMGGTVEVRANSEPLFPAL